MYLHVPIVELDPRNNENTVYQSKNGENSDERKRNLPTLCPCSGPIQPPAGRGDQLFVSSWSLRRLQSNVCYFVNLFPNPFSITVLTWATIVPAILCGCSLGKSVPTPITEHLSILAVILVEIQFKFGTECPFAIAAGVRHNRIYPALS